ncbi:MAG: RagB/SusD family nutrient uptake outer membrane protein [Bacteroidales bacterium]|jgi:hypothetical protein|nr:RagB/SusD family nutrient uptake outer membrane protein [Bacteroidales bacterium]
MYKNMKSHTFLFILPAVCLLFACEQLFEPVNDNHSTYERLFKEPAFAEGLLSVGYQSVPRCDYASDAATDDAVVNNKLDDYLRMATGQWTAMFNPVSPWASAFGGIQSVNHLLSVVDSINWKPSDPTVNELYRKKFKGEAYGIRACLKFYVLMSVAGPDESGNMLGIPILNDYLRQDADFDLPRASFTASVQSIYDDIAEALTYLTMDDYVDVKREFDLPKGYGKAVIGTENGQILFSNYNTLFGNRSAGRISGRILKALRARVALLAASPAYSTDDASLWAAAAGHAGVLLQSIGGVNGLDPEGHRYYLKALVDNVDLTAQPAPKDQKEMIWRTGRSLSNSREAANYPPTFYGNGRYNPTQNIVNAFPMDDGYPIDDLLHSSYDPANPYANRDPRFYLYVIHNNSTWKGVTVTTGVGGANDARDSIPTSTRTGYYLKKHLVEEVNLIPTGPTTHYHYDVYMRYTEFFLIYAEAANEAWGPDGDPQGYGFTARDVIEAIRQRAGISQPDSYLASLSTKEDMRRMIRNERRLELCFEGFRFWDLRRWKENINETARGVEIDRNATQYKYVDVEPRLYEDYMYYGPLPQQDVIRYGNLVQNRGWK